MHQKISDAHKLIITWCEAVFLNFWSFSDGVGVEMSIRTFQRVCVFNCFWSQILYPNIDIEPKPWNSRPMNLTERVSYLFKSAQTWRKMMMPSPNLTQNVPKRWKNTNFGPNLVQISKLTLKLLNLIVITWCEALSLNFFDCFRLG